MEYAKSKRVSLKAHPQFNEKWLQQQITTDSTLLGLGDLDVKDVERRQPRAGRLDVLLFDADTNTRYEVEIQLGPTDESHIIRTLEYWDNERRRFPQYEHIAVIVAEEITGRFLNVINLFNQAIPLIAVQMSALEAQGHLTLHATRVLDLALPAPEEEDEPGQATDRDYWMSKSSPQVMKAVDDVLELINVYGEPVGLNYNKHYIGMQKGGVADNFVQMRPRRKKLQLEFRIDHSEETDAALEEWGLTVLPYDKRWKRYRLQVEPGEVKKQREHLLDLARQARGIPEVAVAQEPSDETVRHA